ncbi:MAG: PTPA-CTERM sorting domain-containing protein [Limnothrix sp.]
MNIWQKSVLAASVACLSNFGLANAAQALEFSFAFSGIDTTNLVDADLILRSGGDADFTTADFKTPFNLDEAGEFFELFVEGSSLGKYACYDADGITNLDGVLYAGDGCDFDIKLFSLVDIFTELERDFLDLIADGSLLVQTFFTGESNIYQGYSLEVVVITYAQTAPINAVPTPVAVLPMVGGLFLRAARRKGLH